MKPITSSPIMAGCGGNLKKSADGLSDEVVTRCFENRPVRGPGLHEPGISAISSGPRALTRRLPAILKQALRKLNRSKRREQRVDFLSPLSPFAPVECV